MLRGSGKLHCAGSSAGQFHPPEAASMHRGRTRRPYAHRCQGRRESDRWGKGTADVTGVEQGVRQSQKLVPAA